MEEIQFVCPCLLGVEGFVADIARPSGMVEIQTGSLYPLARKLPVLLR